MVAMDGESLDAEPAVYYHQGRDFVLLDMIKTQVVYLPDLSDLRPEANIDEAIVGEPGESDPEEEESLRKRTSSPGPGVVCDLEVREAKKHYYEVSEDPRRFIVQSVQVTQVPSRDRLIEYSHSEWTSAIVLVMKRNDTDARLCIDNRLVNELIKLMNYSLPLIDELMSNFAATIGFAVPKTARSQLIRLHGHFQWKRILIGLKNAPLIYQQLLNSSLWGFVRLPPEEDRLVDPEVLEFLVISPETRTPRYPRARSPGGGGFQDQH
ncbi:reverse transcriptase [Phytophthora megakarya]|uniref:Reverse transcriptase n=1 Tax=Phytophthora megakarya TaxID=4795 RepID=A0A225W7V6_9STRA|nr:reverse transcriptase [Phytophthora megakarya]